MSLTITTIQSNLFWEDKAANLKMFEEKIASVQEHKELVVLPEMFSTGFSMNPAPLAEKMDGRTVSWMQEMAAKHKIALTGSFIAEENGHFFNRLVCALPNGNYGYYDKRHLFSYAGEDKEYSKGNKRLIASIKGWRINFQICYDLRFPVWSRQQIKKNEAEEIETEYDVLVYVANWPERRSYIWKTLLNARAIENQAYVVGVNRVGDDGNGIYHSGDSMIINPIGEIYYHCADDEDIFTTTIEKEELNKLRTQYPFWMDADEFSLEK